MPKCADCKGNLEDGSYDSCDSCPENGLVSADSDLIIIEDIIDEYDISDLEIAPWEDVYDPGSGTYGDGEDEELNPDDLSDVWTD